MIGRGQLAGPCLPLFIKMGFFFFNEKQLLMTSEVAFSSSEVAFSLKNYVFIKKILLGAGKLAPNYHFPFR
jgi:hypothetical protein